METGRKKGVFPAVTGIVYAVVFLCAVCFPTLNVRASDAQQGQVQESAPPGLEGLSFEREVEFQYVDCIRIYQYSGGYQFFDVIYSGDQYLLIPEGGEVPEGLDSKITVIHAPLQNVYMAATAIMALVKAAGALDQIRFSSLTADNWYVEEAAEAMNQGNMLFAGKYSEPDYELLLSGQCDLAVESTMILHSPKIKEMLENLGIPVFVDYSSYETHPLARSEWVKVYGAMLGHEEEAEAFFREQSQVMEELEDFENTGRTVAFFYMNRGGTAVVRRNGDSVPVMISLAGGKYVLEDIDSMDDTKSSSVNMTMEEFYAAAVDADYLIYNSTIDAPINSIQDLLDMSPLFADFKAVKEGNVWCTDKYLYQATDIIGELIRDFHRMLTDEDASEMTFLRRIS